MSATGIGITVVVILGLGLAMWWKIENLRCVTCGALHFFESEVYHCDDCGKPFCRDRVAYGEKTVMSVQGRFSSAYGSSSSSISFSGNVCGFVYKVFSNNKVKPTLYLCKLDSEK